KLHVCELSRTLGWDVIENGFAKGWFEAVPRVRAKKREHVERCGSCATYTSCSNCVGLSELEELSPDNGNPYLCDVTDARNELVFGASRPIPNGLIQLRLTQTQPDSAL